MSCQKCGRKDGHNLGCREAARKRQAAAAAAVERRDAREDEKGTQIVGTPGGPQEVERHRTRESECTKDGCSEPRAVSKGPRPAKYCEGHKFKRKAKE